MIRSGVERNPFRRMIVGGQRMFPKIAGLLFVFMSPRATEAACNYCLPGTGETPIPPAQFGYLGSSISPFIRHVALNWVGIVGSPAVDTPSLACVEGRVT